MPEYKTRAELVNQTAFDLGVLASGQTLSDEDYQAIDRHVDGVVRSLEQRSIVSVDADEIPPEYFNHLALCVAVAARAEFGGAEIDVAAAENQLRVMTQTGPTYATLKATYY